MTENAVVDTSAVVHCDLAMREYKDTDGLVEKVTLVCPTLNTEFALSVATQLQRRLKECATDLQIDHIHQLGDARTPIGRWNRGRVPSFIRHSQGF